MFTYVFWLYFIYCQLNLFDRINIELKKKKDKQKEIKLNQIRLKK